MSKQILDVIAVISNPIRWKSRIALYQAFEHHMLQSPNVRLTTVECAYGERDFDIDLNPLVNHVRVRAKSLVWNKENLINIGIQRLPDDWKFVAWIDADITFRDKDWAAKTIDALHQYDVIQPWASCYDLGPNDEHLAHHKSFCRLFNEGKPVGKGNYEFAHPGYAWAATRRAINELGGLLEVAALGSGDHHMALALVGKAEATYPVGIHQNYIDTVLAWQKNAFHNIGQNIGHVPLTIEHSWHGSKVKRGYVDRWKILTRHKFDPLTDVKKNWQGVLELTCKKHGLRHDIDRYFRSRNEDANSID